MLKPLDSQEFVEVQTAIFRLWTCDTAQIAGRNMAMVLHPAGR